MRWHPDRRACVRALAAAAAAAFSLASAGCTFADGAPWGRAAVDLAVQFAPPPERLDAGWLRTDRGYLVRVDALRVRVATMTLQVSAGGGGDLGFDPANPPDGYGLCHGGHCHADDGRLVDYEDIARELAEGALSGGAATTVVWDLTVPVETAPTALPEGRCSDDCRLSRGTLGTVAVDLSEIVARVQVRDASTTAPRLDPDGIALEISRTEPLRFVASLDERIDRGEAVDVHLDTTLSLSPRLFDGIDFAGLPAEGAATAIADAWGTSLPATSALDIEVRRPR